MQLVEKHIIKKNSHLYSECDRVCFLSKNLYNYANYIVRQEFIKTSKEKEGGLIKHANWIRYNSLNRTFIDNHQHDYVMLPRKVSNQTLMMLDKNWKSFFRANKDYNKNKEKYNGRPKLPKYIHKTDGRFITIYELGAISKKLIKKGIVKLSKTDIEIRTNKANINMVRIVPGLDEYTIEIVYTIPDMSPKEDNGRYASIDLGLNNLATITSNVKELKPVIINGKPLKSINQFYNKRLAYYKSKLEKTNKKKHSKRTRWLTNKRNKKIDDYLHKSSRLIINMLKEKEINTLVIGKNANWKQDINIGKTNNQNFVSVPYSRFINMLVYKCEMDGIRTVLQEESYTSKASFLNNDYIPTHSKRRENKYVFSGYRQSRGLYKIKGCDVVINADVNGSYNILRKAFPNIIDGIEGFAVIPVIITIAN